MAKTFKNKPNRSFYVGGEVVWHSRSSSIVAVIIAVVKGEYFVLINKRGGGAFDYKGKWNLCCGYIDWAESGPEAFEREVWEETGVDIEEIKKVNKILFDFTDQPFFVNTDPKENRQNISLSYGLVFETDTLPETTSEYSEPNEIADIKWIKIEDIDKYDFAFNHNQRIKMFLQKIQQ